MSVFTKLGITFLLAVFATGMLMAQGVQLQTSAKMQAANYSKTVIGNQALPDAEVIATGTPMSASKIKSLNIEQQINNTRGTDEIDIIGGTTNAYNSGPRTRGNTFYCSEEKILVEFMGWHDVTIDPTQMWMCIYECSQAIGTYNLVSATDITPAPLGLGWVSSGVINFPLEVGKYYMLLSSFQQACGYYCATGITPFPYPVAFGDAIGAVGFAWTPQSQFPPQQTLTPEAGAWDDPVLYYQQLITTDPITDNNDMGIESIVSPSSGTELTTTEAITVTIKNYGFNAQSGFEVSYTLDGGIAIVETIAETINSGETLEHTFATTVDLSTIGTYEIEACAILTGDENPENDCTIKIVEHIAQSYCNASTTSEEEYIANVLCGTIDNASVWQNGVADYTDLSCTIGAGTFEAITVTNGSPNAYDKVYAWVDWNDDFVFETGGDEEFELICDATGAEFSGNIAVPENAPLGDHRMRIRMAYGSADPCGSTVYGEVEEYTIMVITATFGNLSGEVSAEGGGAIQGATITVAGETTTTASDGSYSFTDIFTGTHKVSCDANGFTSGIETVVIEEGQTATLDFELEQVETGTLEGVVSAPGGIAIQGAIISIDGQIFTTGADGTYTIENILVGTYTVSCTASGYDAGSETAIIEDGQTTTLDFELNVASPAGFTATVFDGNDVDLNWVAPGAVGYFQWDSGINTGNGIGIGNGGTFSAASRWTPSDLEPYAGKTMTSITFFCNGDPNATFILKVWVGENAAMEILSQEVVDVEVNAFNEIVLDTPIQIDASRELWFGYQVSHTGGSMPAGVDDGPAVSGYGDLYSTDGTTWFSISNSWGLDYNWNLAGYLVEPDKSGKSIKSPMLRTEISNPAIGGQLVASGPGGTVTTMDRTSEKSLLGYNLYRDGIIIAEEIQETTYQDMNLTAGMYTYDVKAVYDDGLSLGAGPLEVTILGGVDRELVIIEVATGTWCQYCPGASMAVDEMHAEGLSVGVIEYHSGDDYETSETAARLDYYNVAGYPTAMFDGGGAVSGGSATQSMYADYLPKYETRIATPSLFDIEAHSSNTGGNDYQISVDIEMIEEYPLLGNDLVLHVVLTESHIPESWQNQPELNFVCRDMVPNENGTSLDFSGSTTQSLTLDFTIPSNYVMENLELLAYIQDNSTKEILQGSMALLITGIEDVLSENQIAVYPNPATDVLYIETTTGLEEVQLFNLTGQLIFTHTTTGKKLQINTSTFESGIYFIKVFSQDQIITKKLVIE